MIPGLVDSTGAPWRGAEFTNFTAHLRSYSETAAEELRCGVLAVLRARCRDLYRNNDIAHGAIDTVARRVVGSGLTFLPSLLDPNGERLKEENEALRALWNLFCLDISTRGHKVLMFLKLLIRTYLRDGEVFLVLTDLPDLPFCCRWQLIEGDQLPEDNLLQVKAAAGNHVEAGIEFNHYGRPVAYHFFDDGRDIWGGELGRKIKRVPAERVLHWSNASRFGSPRGVPYLAPVIMKLADNEEFLKAILVKAWVHASMTAFVTSKTPEAAQVQMGMRPGAVQNPNQIAPTSHNAALHNARLGHGNVFVTDENTEVKLAASNTPPQNMQEFNDVILHGIAAGLGISFQLLSRSLRGVSYSGGRQADNEDREGFKALAREMDEEMILPMWRTFIDYVYHIEQRRPEPKTLDKYAVQIFHPQPPPIDPVKQQVSNEKALAMRSVSPQQVCADQGRALSDVLKDWKEANEMFAEAGLTIGQTSTAVTLQYKETDEDGEQKNAA